MAKSEKQPEVAQNTMESVEVRPNGRDSTPVSVSYDLPQDLNGLVEKFGEDIVVNKAREKIIINLQDTLRRTLKKEPNADLQKVADEFRPGIRARGASKKEKAQNLFASLSEEDRAELLKQFTG